MNVFKSFIAKGRIAMVLLLGLSLFATTGCREDEPPAVWLSVNNISVDEYGSSYAVQVRSNTQWVASSNVAWAYPSVYRGRGTTDIMVIVEAQTDDTPRTGMITFTTLGANSQPAYLVIQQGAESTSLNITPTSITADNKSQTVAIAVASNTTWTATATHGWMTITSPAEADREGNKTLLIELDANEMHSATRVGSIILVAGTSNAAGQITKECVITQLSRPTAELKTYPAAMTFPAQDDPVGSLSQTATIITNLDATTNLTAASEFTWCTAVVDNATDPKTVTVTVQPNTTNGNRDCIVTVIGTVDGGTAVTSQIRVTQAGVGSPIVTLLRNIVTLPKDASVTANSVGLVKSSAGIAINLDVSDNWITDATYTPNGTLLGDVTFKVTENTDASARTGTITVVASIGDQTLLYPITIYQAGVGTYTVKLYSDYANLTAASYVGYTVKGYLTEKNAVLSAVVTEGDGWITNATATADAASVSGYTTLFDLKFDAAANTSAANRTGTIVVIARLGTQTAMTTLSVVQAGIGAPNITFVGDAVTVPQAGVLYAAETGLQILGATTATTITATCADAGWLAAKAVDTNTDGILDKLIFEAQPNNNSATRTQTVTVVASQGGATQIIPITVTQPGTGAAILNIPVNAWEFNYEEVVNQLIAVLPVGTTTYTVAQYPSWMTTAPAQGAAPNENALVVNLPKNTSAKERSGAIILLATNGDSNIFYTIDVKQTGIEGPAVSVFGDHVYLPVNDGAIPVAGAATIDVPLNNVQADLTFGTIYVSAPTWLGATYGADNAFVTITAQPSTISANREGVVSFTVSRGGVMQTITFYVTQYGNGAPALELSTNSIQVGPAAVDVATNPIQVYITNAADATVTLKSTMPTWVTKSGDFLSTDGSVLTFGVAENASLEARNATFVIEATKGNTTAQYTVILTQSGQKGLAASLAQTNVTVPATAAGAVLPQILINNLPLTTTDIDFSSVFYSMNPNWITAAVSAADPRVITLSALTDNTSTKERSITITFTLKRGTTVYDTEALTLTVTQEAATLPIVSPSKYSYEFVAAPVAPADAVAVTLDGWDTATHGTPIFDAAPANWLAVAFNAGVLTFTVQNNTGNAPREQEVMVRIPNKIGAPEQAPFVITIKQQGLGSINASVSTQLINIGQAAIAAAVNVPINMPNPTGVSIQSITVSDDWLTVTNTSVAPALSVGYTATENTTFAPRIANVKVVLARGADTQTVEFDVKQAGKDAIADLQFNRSVVNFGALTDLTVAITPLGFVAANYTSVAATSDEAWITAPIAVDAATGVITVVATANSGKAVRNGQVDVTVTKADGTKQYISLPVVQLGVSAPNVTLVTPDQLFPQLGAAQTAMFSNPGAVELQVASYSPNTMFTAAPAFDAAFTTLSFTLTDNAGNDERTGYIVVNAVENGVVTATYPVTVRQAGLGSLYASLSQPSVNFPATGAVMVPVTINAPAGATLSAPTTSAAGVATVAVNGMALEITPAEANTTLYTQKTATVSVTVTLGTQTTLISIPVTQAPLAAIADLQFNRSVATFGALDNLLVNISALGFVPANFETISLNATSDDPWLAGGITTNPATGEINVSALANTGKAVRNGQIDIVVNKIDGTKQYLSIPAIQQGVSAPNVTLITPDQLFPQLGAAQTAMFSNPDAVTLQVASYSPNTMFTAAPAFDATFTTLSFTLTDNGGNDERTGYIVVNAVENGVVTATYPVTVRQAGLGSLYASLSQPSVNFPATGAVMVPVTINAPAGATLNSPATSDGGIVNAGINGMVLEVTPVEANTTLYTQKTATVSVTVQLGAQTTLVSIPVTQAPLAAIPDLMVANNSVLIPALGTAQTVSIPNWVAANYTSVTATTTDAWITVPAAAIAATTFQISATDNSWVGSPQQTGKVMLTIVKADGTTQYAFINVTQAGTGAFAPSVSPGSFTFSAPADATGQIATVTSQGAVTFGTITISPANNFAAAANAGAKTVTFTTTADNLTSTNLVSTATIPVTVNVGTANEATVNLTVTLTQKPRTALNVSLSTTLITLPANNATLNYPIVVNNPDLATIAVASTPTAPNWVTITAPAAASSNLAQVLFTLDVQANVNEEPQSGWIYFSATPSAAGAAAGVMPTTLGVYVVQAGKTPLNQITLQTPTIVVGTNVTAAQDVVLYDLPVGAAVSIASDVPTGLMTFTSSVAPVMPKAAFNAANTATEPKVVNAVITVSSGGSNYTLPVTFVQQAMAPTAPVYSSGMKPYTLGYGAILPTVNVTNAGTGTGQVTITGAALSGASTLLSAATFTASTVGFTYSNSTNITNLVQNAVVEVSYTVGTGTTVYKDYITLIRSAYPAPTVTAGTFATNVITGSAGAINTLNTPYGFAPAVAAITAVTKISGSVSIAASVASATSVLYDTGVAGVGESADFMLTISSLGTGYSPIYVTLTITTN